MPCYEFHINFTSKVEITEQKIGGERKREDAQSIFIYIILCVAFILFFCYCLGINEILQLLRFFRGLPHSVDTDYYIECGDSIFSVETIKDWTKCEELQQVMALVLNVHPKEKKVE